MADPYPTAVLALPGLVGYWPFSEGVGTTAHDLGPNPADMTPNGVPPPSWGPTLLGGGQGGASTIIQKSLDHFWRTIVDPPSKNVGDVFTVIALIKPTAEGVAAGNHFVVSKGLNSYGLMADSGDFLVAKTGIAAIGRDGALTAGTRYWLAWSKNGATNIMVRDGVDVTPAITNAACANTTDQLDIGNDFLTNFDGQIAQVSLQSVAMSLAALQALYPKVDQAPSSSGYDGAPGGGYW